MADTERDSITSEAKEKVLAAVTEGRHKGMFSILCPMCGEGRIKITAMDGHEIRAIHCPVCDFWMWAR